MAFWSGPTIRQRLSTLVDPADPNCVDGAAYMLKVGTEYYVTPTDQDADPKSRSLKRLSPGECFAIPPGQFAYVMTEEIVSVPTNVLGFISIRARIKWKGLVNVSGFHVDPGFRGRLTFSVFNAGPGSIHLRQGDAAFLIWFADLDADAGADAKQMSAPATRMDVNILNQVTGELNSLEGLAEKLRRTDRELREKINDIRVANATVNVAATLVIALAVAIGGRYLYDWFVPAKAQPPAAAQSANPGKAPEATGAAAAALPAAARSPTNVAVQAP
jgi:dCTP deaminase